MAFDKAKILAEGGTYHGAENPLIECSTFVASKVTYEPVSATGAAPAHIKEDANLPKRMMIEGVFQREAVRNVNRRLYPAGMFRTRLSEGGAIRNRIAERSMIGHLEHPESGTTDLNKGAILVTDAWVTEDGTVVGRALVYNTPEGLRLQEYIATGTKVGISSRGTGTVDSKGIVQEDYALETWDMVYSPSTPGAHPTLKTESTNDETPFHGVVESREERDTLKPTQGKIMSISAAVAESKNAAARLLAVDPAKLPLPERAKLADELLDMRVKVAEDFQGEKRVEAVTELLALIDKARKACSETMSGGVGGFQDAPIAPTPGANMDDAKQGDQTGVPGNQGADELSKGLATLAPEARQAAQTGYQTAADIIAKNLGQLPKMTAALEACLKAEPEVKVEEKKMDEETASMLSEVQDELIKMTEREEAAAAIISELRERVVSLQGQVKEAVSAKEAAEKAVTELTSVNYAQQVKEAIEKAIKANPELDAFRDVLESADTAAGVEVKAATLVKSIQEKAAKRLAESAAAKNAKKPLDERLAEAAAKRAAVKVDESLPGAGKPVKSQDDAGEPSKEPTAVNESREVRQQKALIGGLARALKSKTL